MKLTAALDDPAVFGPYLADASWDHWKVFVAALEGSQLGNPAADLYRQCAGRGVTGNGTSGFEEAWLICGRRAGKSFVLAVIATYLAAFRDWRQHLGPGERATVAVIAADRSQARVILRYIKGLLYEVPMLRPLIEREREDSLDLKRRVTIEVRTANFRTIRGYTIVAALLDEIAFWRSDDSANPDSEILAALRPAMATVPGAMLLAASSPYARRGALYRAWRDHFGKDDSDVLVWQADTLTMNPALDPRVVEAAYASDPASASAEYGAQFRADIASFIDRGTLEGLVTPDCRERPPVDGLRYIAFVDPSGGSSDSMTLAIAHADKEGRAVLDAVRECKPPFSPEAVTSEFATLLKSYRLREVRGDRYGGQWPAERFAAHGITYRPADRAKSDLYRDLLPLLNADRADLLDHPGLVTQLASLERRTARGGKDSIDHAPGGHDDVANAVAGAVVLAGERRKRPLHLDPAAVAQMELTRDEPGWVDDQSDRPWADRTTFNSFGV